MSTTDEPATSSPPGEASTRSTIEDSSRPAGPPTEETPLDRDVEQGDVEQGDVEHEASRPLPRWARWLAFAVVGVIAMWFWSGFQMEGHNGGDDFALYINQGRSLLHGDVGQTLANTHFTVDNSAWHTFSPYAYPWGLPLMLAAVMAFTGTVDVRTGVDYAPLKFMISACFLVGLFAYAAMLRRRVHPLGTVVLPLFFALNFVYVLHTDNVLSELPFLMSLMLFVVALDRMRERGQLIGPRLVPLVGIGLLGCYAFNIRREGLGVMFGLAVAQLVAVVGATDGDGWRSRLANVRELDWRAIGTPWATFAGVAVLFQLLLPSDMLPRFVERDPTATAGLHRIIDNMRIYEPLLGEQLGLKDFGPTEITAFGSTSWGAAVYWAVIAFAVLGMVLAAVKYPARELPVIAVFLGVLAFVLIAPFQTYRYIMSLVPFLLYFAYQGIALPIRSIPLRHVGRAVLVADVAVITFILGGWPDTSNARDYRSNWVGPQAGPQQVEFLEMYDAVRERTRGDAVIVANRARLMTLYTGRASVQGGAIDFIEDAGDYYVMYLEPDGTPGTYTQYPLTDTEAAERGFVEIWRNDGWVLWRNPLPGNDP